MPGSNPFEQEPQMGLEPSRLDQAEAAQLPETPNGTLTPDQIGGPAVGSVFIVSASKNGGNVKNLPPARKGRSTWGDFGGEPIEVAS